MPGNDLRCGLLENDRSDVVRHDTAQLGVSKINEWALSPSSAAPQAESAAAITSDGT